MNTPSVVVVDYGVGNLLSVRRGLECCGARVTVTVDPEAVYTAPRVVLPGVGAFANGMAALHRVGLDVAVKEVAARGTPLLGICLGMQMLLDESEEFGLTSGLGLIPGRVMPMPAPTTQGVPQKIPHIGWSSLILPEERASWEGSLLQGVTPGEAVYFVHSFMAVPAKSRDRIGDCLYGVTRVPAAIGCDNVVGCQFHPEKSGLVGLAVLRSFLAQ